MNFSKDMKFVVREFNLSKNKMKKMRSFIVVSDKSNNIVLWTNFHMYADTSRASYYYIVQFLNFLFIERNIKVLTNLTFELVKEFLDCYGLGLLKGDKDGREKDTVEICRRAIIHFCENVYKKFKEKCQYNPSEFYDYTFVIDPKGKKKKVKKLAIQAKYKHKEKRKLKDLPSEVFFVFLDYIMNNYIDILMPVALTAFVGLRPSECMNVRREDSLLGSGIIIERFGNKIQNIKFDLWEELNLRSDLKSVGDIKVERMQQMDPMFIDIFMICYEKYLNYISDKKYEIEYGPLIIDKNGKAMLYSNYEKRFKEAINEIRPILLNSGNESLMSYSELMGQYSVSPHILRHWFSVQIALNYQNISILMSARGDKDPESAQTYLQNKSELSRAYQKVNDYTAEFLKVQGERLFG